MFKLIYKSNKLNIVLEEEILILGVKKSLSNNDPKIDAVLKKEEQDSELFIQCYSASPCDKYLAVCYEKELVIYDTKDYSVFCSSKADRNPTSIQFFYKHNLLLVADKSGCVHFFNFEKNILEKISELTLAHNSMLTGALVTEDENYVITCDRDEKIRVTHFPNVYNIQSYCLGHTQFITYMEFLPHDQSVLVSSSGDGTIRFWDFINGKEILKYTINDAEETFVITKVLCLLKDTNCSLVAIQSYMRGEIIMLCAQGNLKNGLTVSLKDKNILDSVPLDISFYNEDLLALFSKKPYIDVCFPSACKETKNMTSNVAKLLSNHITKELDPLKRSLIPILHKREFDNVKEYQERKKLRLSS